jgi:hypothetical protein
MRKRIARLLVCFCTFVSVAVLPNLKATAAEVVFENSKQEIILFHGIIDQPSVSKLTELLSRWQLAQRSKKTRPIVKIESPGGDVDAALIAGRALRQAKATVFVEYSSPDQANCSSSCVFLVAGAVERYILGGLGIHNFFIASNDQTYEQVATTRRRLETSIRNFLVEMNVSPLLYDRMVAIPPQSLRLLAEQELKDLGLGMTDPTFRDFRHGEEASRRGIDKATYIARLGSLIATCGQLPVRPSSPETRDELKAYLDQLKRYNAQFERWQSNWNECKEGVLSGRIVK